MYNLTEYGDKYSKTSESLWKCHRDELADAILNSESFQFKIRITEENHAAGNIKNVEVAVP